MANRDDRQPKGRVVLNHSTHIHGLVKKLQRLALYPNITTITPGAISRSRGSAPRLRLRISTPIRGGFKLIARKGTSVQEVFVLTTLGPEALQAAIASVL